MGFRCKSASVFIDGTKVGQFEGVTYEINSGDEAQFGDGGFLGYSDGATTTSMTATGVTPVAGIDYDIVSALLNKQDLPVTLALIDGHIHEVLMRTIKADFKGSQKSGTLMGEFSFGGGKPVVTG